MTITERVYEILNQQGKTQAALAEYVGSTKSSVNYWFKRSGDIPCEFLAPICTFLGVSPNYLITGVPDEVVDTKPHDDTLSEDEVELLRIFRILDREGRTMVLASAYSQRSRVFAQGENKASVTA